MLIHKVRFYRQKFNVGPYNKLGSHNFINSHASLENKSKYQEHSIA